jgi:hypothetical protein
MIGAPIFAHVGGGPLPDHDDLMLLGPILVLLLIGSIVAVSWLANRGVLGEPDRTVGIDISLASIAAALSFGVAAIHLAVIDTHLDQGVAFGAFFLVVGWFQMLWPLAWFLRRTNTIAVVGLFVNLAVAGTWLMSRTVGMPFDPTPWVPEPVGLVDLLATLIELGIVGLLLPVAMPDRGNAPRRLVPIKDAVILAAFAIATVALLSGYALLVPVAPSASSPTNEKARVVAGPGPLG